MTILATSASFTSARRLRSKSTHSISLATGWLHGRVLNVSQDSIARDKPQDRANDKAPGVESATSEPKSQELVYAALTPGMAVTVEVKIGLR
jgi:hypothetical protein